MVFGCSDVTLDRYISHVEAIAKSQKEISFNCRYAMLHNDDSNDNYYVFLVPDVGYAEISKLHDKLYSGEFASFLRLDIPYIPHIGIATIPDANLIKNLCDELNSKDINITGNISSLTVSEYDGSKITDIERFRFST